MPAEYLKSLSFIISKLLVFQDTSNYCLYRKPVKMSRSFDGLMEKNYANMPFERYCDDAIIHCSSEKQAQFIKSAIAKMMWECGLMLNYEKTHIVYCKSHIHKERHKILSFDFLGYTFRPIYYPLANGWKLSYLPCMSTNFKNTVRQKLKKIIGRKFKGAIELLARILNTIKQKMVSVLLPVYNLGNPWTLVLDQ